MTTTDERPIERCRCGRDMRLLNEASDTPRCVGCGYTPELCRCETRVD